MAERAIATVIFCEARRHEIGWLTAVVASFGLSAVHLTLIDQFTGFKIATG
jgi:hypothetical protein